MIARAGLLPSDERAQRLWHNIPELLFVDYWQDQIKREDLRDLSRALGILWTREDVEDDESVKKVRKGVQPNELRVPLTYVIEPGIVDIVKKFFGKKLGIDPPEWAKTTEVVDLYQSNREDFLNFIRSFVAPKAVQR